MDAPDEPELTHRAGNGARIVRSWLQENEYADTSDDQDVFDLVFGTEEGDLSVRIIAADDSGWILLVAHGDFEVAPESVPAVLDACNRINFHQLIGSVSLEPGTPDLQCRHFLPHAPGALDRAVFCSVVEAWIGNALRSLAALRRVSEGRATAEQATAWLTEESEEQDEDSSS